MAAKQPLQFGSIFFCRQILTSKWQISLFWFGVQNSIF